ncbi:hypothetical protein QR680_002900 [Steinernema hermaphroditum]|uniref:Uncharacterized protein n=1 Tax=Steinernema hermaphroditum TaxID=289476 RepID=A0AA39H6D2_9BILA|nr:hypothetical protein QR680_002900 [Steinernema hermaphroditum]
MTSTERHLNYHRIQLRQLWNSEALRRPPLFRRKLVERQKSLMTVIRLPNGGYRIYAKGASEIVLSRCSYILGKDGELTPLGDGQKAEMTKTVIEPMASDGLRTIGLAYKDFVPENAARNEVLMTGDINWDDEETIRDAMVAIAVVGLQKERNNNP